MPSRNNKQREFDSYLERTKRNHFWTKGIEGQLKVRNLKVGVAGLGGMGSNIAEILVRLGVGCLHLADPDRIEASNMNRQVVANLNTLGQMKVSACMAELLSIEPDLQVKEFPDGIHKDNVDLFVEGLDIVINEIDVLHVDKQILLLEAAMKRKIPVYTTLVVGLGIHLYKFSPESEYSPRDFLGLLLENQSLEQLIKTFGHPLPSYMQNSHLDAFKKEITRGGGIPIFGASTYLGQSILVIRALADQGYLTTTSHLPQTPCLPEFLILDPLTLELKTVSMFDYENSKSSAA